MGDIERLKDKKEGLEDQLSDAQRQELKLKGDIHQVEGELIRAESKKQEEDRKEALRNKGEK